MMETEKPVPHTVHRVSSAHRGKVVRVRVRVRVRVPTVSNGQGASSRAE